MGDRLVAASGDAVSLYDMSSPAQPTLKSGIRIVVSDGRAEDYVTFRVEVARNRPPFGRAMEFSLRVDDYYERDLPVIAEDPDGDPLMVRTIAAPAGVTIFVSEVSRVRFHWLPTEEDVGEHLLVYEVSDGEATTIVRTNVQVDPPYPKVPYFSRGEWTGILLPGAGAIGFLSHHDGELLLGGAFQVTMIAKRHPGFVEVDCRSNHHACRPSHSRIYGEFEVLGSLRAHEPELFTYAVGGSSTLESYPARRFLIPLYGFEFGGLYREGLGHRLAIRPYLGSLLWASDGLWVTAGLGYRVVPVELPTFSGPTLALSATLSRW